MTKLIIDGLGDDDFGDRMKFYEGAESGRRFDVKKPIYARIDGRTFSNFTKRMKRPFDEKMTDAMIETAKFLVDETHAKIGYVQSDEISLVWLAENEKSDIFFGGKVMKMASVLASMAAAKFATTGIEGATKFPHFDCRVLQLPNKIEAANMILWRALDARKNSIAMVAQSMHSPKALHKVNQMGMLDMISAGSVAYEGFPTKFKDGTFLQRKSRLRSLTDEELARIPEGYRPPGPVMRSSVEALPINQFKDVTNRIEVIFDGADPVEKTNEAP